MKPWFRSSHIPPRALLISLFILLAAAMETAQAQVVALSATSISFGSVVVGTNSVGRNVTLRNTSTTTALSVTSIMSNGPFSQTNTCGNSVAAGRSCVITVTFQPTALATSTGSIVITDNASPGTQTITLTGTGVAPITMTPASRSFGSVGEGSTSAAFTFSVRNNQTQAAALTISTALPFAQTNTCGTSLAAVSTCSVSVTFSPTTLGAQTGSLTVAPATGSPLTATLTGTGVLPITLTPASRSFGSVGQGTTSAALTFSVRNNQTQAAALTISTALPFAQTNTCGTSLAAASTCSISVTFSPTTLGAQTGSLTVAPATGSPLTATLTGTGVLPITIAPASRAFGSVAQGYTSPARTFSVTNYTTAAIPLTITSTNTLFAVTGCGASLAARSSCTLSVTFAPTTATPPGAQTGSIVVAYTGTGSPQSIPLAATVITPLTASPTTIAFSTVTNVGVSSQPRSVTISNRAPAPIAIGSMVASPAAYAITANTCSSSLNTAASCTVTVVFTPTVVGTTTGNLTITYGTANSQLVVAMTGGAQVNNLRSLVITVPNASIPAGTSEQLTATATYSSGTTGNVTSVATWVSSNPNVASVTSNGGLVTGVTAGTAQIKASVTGTNSVTVTNTASVIVTGKTITALSVSAPLASIYPLGTDQFTATATYSDGTSGTVAATFSSSNTGVATINSTTGLATGVLSPAVGTTDITASVPGGLTSPPFLLTVAGVQSVAVTPLNPSVPLGLANPALPYGPTNNSVPFTAIATYTDNTTANVTSSATWQSTSPGIASINSAGLATVLTQGSTTINASFASLGSSLLTIQPPVLESVAVCLGPYPSSSCSTSTASVGTTLGLNATQQFSAVGTYSDNSTQNLTSLATWAAHDPQEVTINSTGLAKVVATDNGAHAITASYGNFAPYQNSDTGWITASSTAPISCPTPTIDMRLLVINNAGANGGAGYADFPAIQQILSYVGTPYDVVDVTGTLPALSDGACHGYYQGVIYAFGDDIYTNPTSNTTLTTYEQTFKVRQLNWFTNPTPDFGFNNYASSIPSTGTDSGSFTSAAAPVFFYANTANPVAISNAFVYLTTPTTPSGGGTVTPLIVDSGGYTLSGVTNFSDGREYLSQMFDSNQYLTHNLVLAYGLLNWVTKGVFLGDYHVYASQQVDDFFINDSEWIPSTTCLTNLATKDRTAPDASNLPVFRVNTADMTQLANWQTGIQNDSSGLFKQFKLTMAFNGAGTVGNGDWTGLTAPIIASSATNGVANFTAQSFSGLPGQTVTVTNTTNGTNGVLNGTWTIVSVTPSAANTPNTTTFTANIPAAGTLAQQAENGVAGNSTTATASVPDDLVANLRSYEGAFHWITHTFNHPSTLNGLCQSQTTGSGCGDAANNPPTDYIDLEILTNRWIASDPNALPAWQLDLDSADRPQQLTFTDFNPANIVTPGVTGLNDPNVPGYLYNDGIRFAVTDTSVIGQPNNGPNPSPNVGIANSFAPGLYEVPRHPNDIFYNTANWADNQTEFVCIYQNYVPPNSPPGTPPAPDPPFNTYNAAQILDFTSSAFLTNMLMGDMDPEMFHQPDLHFADNYPALTATPFGPPSPPVTIPGLTSPHVSSLISDAYDLTFNKYKRLYKLPVLSPTLDQVGLLMQNRNSFNLSGVTASIAVGTSGSQITLTMPSTATVPSAVIPVTGLTSTGAETYGGQNISHINMTPGTVVTFPLP